MFAKNAAAVTVRHHNSSIRRAVAPVLEALEDRRLLSATISITNADGQLFTNRLIFNRIQTLDTKVPNKVHDKVTLTIKNTGDQTLTLGTIAINGPWTLSTPPASNSLAPGASEPITVQFTQTKLPPHSPANQTNFTSNPNGGASITGSMIIPSNDPANASSVFTLAGYWQSQSENNAEPNLTVITNLLAGYGTVISTPYKVDLTEPSGATREGSEVISPAWIAADSTKPVSVRQLAAFHTEGNVVHTYWFTGDTTSQVSHQLFSSVPSEGQTLLPHNSAGGPLAASFTPNGAFGFRVDSDEFSNDAINMANGNTAGGGHHFRFYPLVDSSGNAVPNTWLVGMDYAVIQTENFDFQDNVYIVSNMAPAAAPTAPANLAATNVAHPVLSWTAESFPGLVGYRVYKSTTGPTGTFTLLNPDPNNSNVSTTTNTFTDSTNVATGPIYYRVTAVATISGSAVESGPATTSALVPAGPIAVNDTGFFTQQDIPVTINVLANDTDAAATINPASVVVTSPVNGTATVDNNGSVTFTPTAGFSGNASFTYTYRDSNNTQSNVATASITVKPLVNVVSNPVALDVSFTHLAAGSFIIHPSATDADGNPIVPANITFPVAPANGAVTFNSDGTITYTPTDGANFVGGDAFTYKVVDSAGHTSDNVGTVTMNIGVEISSSSTTARRIIYTDGSGSQPIVTISSGIADVFFSGAGVVQSTKNGLITIANNSQLGIATVALSSTNAASALVIVPKGNKGNFTLGGVSDAGVVGSIIAPKGNLIGPVGVVNVDVGGLSVLVVNQTTNSIIDVGSGIAAGPALLLGPVVSSSLNATGAVRLIKATNWINSTNGTLQVAATSLGTLLISGAKGVSGDFAPNLLVGGGSAQALGVAVVAGQAALGSWDINGGARAIVLGSTANSWNLNVSGALANMVVRTGGLPADVSVGTLGVLNVTGNINDSLTVQSAHVIRASGDIGSTTITSAGDLFALVAASLTNSNVTAGNVTTTFTAASPTAAELGSSTISNVVLTSHAANAFSGSTIMARTITTARLGSVDTTKAGGLAAGKFSNVLLTIGATSLHLGPNDLSTAGDITSFKGTDFGNFRIRVLA